MPWHIWIDTGGTFTDCLARDPAGALHRAKVLSTGALRGRILQCVDDTRLVVQQNWASKACDDLVCGFHWRLLGDPSEESVGRVAGFRACDSVIVLEQKLAKENWIGRAFEVCGHELAPVLAARLVTGTPANRSLPPIQMRLATTRGTNALLERKGAPTALFISEGFADLLEIGDQQRPNLFALNIIKTAALHAKVFEVRERIAANGAVLRGLDLDHLRARAKLAFKEGLRVAAVALVHSYLNSDHERQVNKALREAGFEHVTLSSDLAPLIRIVPRAQSAIVDAYLAPMIDEYLQDVSRHVASLHVMTSAGGLVRAAKYRASESLLSGPAGGVAGAAGAGRRSGFSRIIGFDMGGTSTDVARYDGDFEYKFEHGVAGARILAPALAIETVAAGGGSICEYIHGRLAVGPHSAGADPGPACYAAGGPLTLTDVNLLLGRLDEVQFEIPVSKSASHAALNDLVDRIESQTGSRPHPESLLSGLLDIANERMAAAIESVSVRRGYDPRDYALVSFGGAGGQHACAIAQRLDIRSIVMPADASLLSAVGLDIAVIERISQRQVLRILRDDEHQLERDLIELEAEATAAVLNEGIAATDVIIRRRIIELRLLGQDATLSIELVPADDHAITLSEFLTTAFREQYAIIYGHAPPLQDKPIEVESLRVIASQRARPDRIDGSTPSMRQISPVRFSRCHIDGTWREIASFDRRDLAPGDSFDGPAIVLDQRSTFIIEPGWSARIDAADAIVLRHAGHRTQAAAAGPDLVRVELFANRFASIAADMGQMLQRTALSTNVKERLDFSCAILDARGELVANAPHIPVHLGALGVCVRAVMELIEIGQGDVIVTNHPAFGGSHLPDVTVIAPIHVSGVLIGFAANRAHHAEIGGLRPGSMPPNAVRLSDEGVVIPPMYLVHRGKGRFDDVEKLLRESPNPSRAVADNLADLRAAAASCQRGVSAMRDLVSEHGADEVIGQMRVINARAELLARAALKGLPARRFHAREQLDDRSPIVVNIDLSGDVAVIDFAGSAPQHPGNLNATPAIVRSAVMYVLKLLVGENLPLNEGIMRAVDVRIPRGMLNPGFADDAAKSPAVVGGNVETSQRVVDALLKALELCACSQGTMNNTLFGNEKFGYYETVCGGAGAGPGFCGASAVHTHMTNTRMTDVEIIEHRYPVRVERFAIRRESGGAGAFRGGDGVVREITFLEPMSLSLLTQHRVEAPFGMRGGANGQRGRQKVIRAGGQVIHLNSIDSCEMQPGDRLILETPGGGGWG